jgi:hypothetical protein
MSLVGSPEANGMMVVTADKMSWTETKFMGDKTHFLSIVGCELEAVGGEGQPIEGTRFELDVGGVFTKKTKVFVFSDLKPGEYHVATFRASHQVRAPDPNYPGSSGEYEVFRYTFPRDEFPRLSLGVPMSGIVFVGNVHFAARHGGDDEAITMSTRNRGAKLSLSRADELEVLKSLVKSDPDGSWASTLRARVSELEAQ